MLTEFSVVLIQQAALTKEQVDRIIALKQQYWPYPLKSQRQWMNDNLYENEYHLWIDNKDGEMAAYLNIIFTDVVFSGRTENMAGIGNVCVSKKYARKGIGVLLMQIAGYYTKSLGKNGVLLCKNSLTAFYLKAGWKKYEGKVVFLGKEYGGAVMFNELPNEATVAIERNF